MLELLLELLWSKTLSAPSFGHYWKQPIWRPYLKTFFIIWNWLSVIVSYKEPLAVERMVRHIFILVLQWHIIKTGSERFANKAPRKKAEEHFCRIYYTIKMLDGLRWQWNSLLESALHKCVSRWKNDFNNLSLYTIYIYSYLYLLVNAESFYSHGAAEEGANPKVCWLKKWTCHILVYSMG